MRSLTLWSIYLARRFDDEWVMTGPPRFFFPAEWERFIGMVPAEHRDDPGAVIDYYYEQLRHEDRSIAFQYAVEWTLWETALTSLNYDPARNETEISADPATPSLARLEAHYFAHRCFIPENYIINKIPILRDIPCTVVQGRFDMCTPPTNAYELARGYGHQLNLKWVNSGHLRTDPEMQNALQETINSLR